MFKELFSRSHEFVGPQVLFSQEAAARQIELRFIERVVSEAIKNVSVDSLHARAREEEALMRAVEAGAFDSKIVEILSDVKASGLRSFDDAQEFSYGDWASRKLKPKE
jgi:hypothetical protein